MKQLEHSILNEYNVVSHIAYALALSDTHDSEIERRRVRLLSALMYLVRRRRRS